MKVGSVFSGIGGFDLGLERAGMEIVWQIEKDEFCLKVLEKHWPKVRKYKDIREVNPDELKPVDLVCGGFPCQPYSVAGKRRGKDDDRHLWPEMFKIIRRLKPDWIILENVPGIIDMELDKVLSDLENENYTTESFIIPACAVGADHRRDRVWICAYSNSLELAGGEKQNDRKTPHKQLPRLLSTNIWPDIPRPGIRRVANGFPDRMDRTRALGNAVVPQIVQIIGTTIMEVEYDRSRNKENM